MITAIERRELKRALQQNTFARKLYNQYSRVLPKNTVEEKLAVALKIVAEEDLEERKIGARPVFFD